METKRVFVPAAVLSVFCMLPSFVWGSPAVDLMSKLPADTSCAAATSGLDALEAAFEQSYPGQIWSDPQVQAFYHGIVDPLLEKVPEGMDPNDMKQIRAVKQFAEMCLRKPIALGVLTDDTNPDFFASLYFAMDTGADKPAYEKTLQELLEAMQISPRSRMLGGRAVWVPDDSEKTPVYWGWVGTVLVAAGNDPSGRLIGSFGTGPSFRARQAFSGLADRGDVLAMYWDIRTMLDQTRRQIVKKETAEGAAKFEDTLRKLGLDQIQRFALRGGFEGRTFTAESVLENASAPRGLLAQLGSVQPEIFCVVNEQAYEMMAANVSLSGIYDVVLDAFRGGLSAGEIADLEQKLSELEGDLGFSIRGDFLASFAGPLLGYLLPAFTIPEAPNGGVVLLADLNSPKSFAKSMKALENYVQRQAKEQLQIQCQPVGEGQTLCIWVSPVLSIMQVMPCWMIQDSKVIIASHPTLAQSAAVRLRSSSAEGTVCQSPRFQSVRGSYPPSAVFLSYIDTTVQVRQFLTKIQQFWPMLAMAATQKGILLPMMLPNLDKYLADLPPTIKYTLQTSRGLESRYAGPGLELSSTTLAGGAMGAAILMPALNKTKQVAQRVVSATNLKSIGTASAVYANDHDGLFPPDLETLIEAADLDPKTLESPYARRKTTEGPDYIYISGQPWRGPLQNVLAYDNPTFERDPLNVLYLDGHVEPVDLARLQKDVKRTYEALGRPIPEAEAKRLKLSDESSQLPGVEN